MEDKKVSQAVNFAEELKSKIDVGIKESQETVIQKTVDQLVNQEVEVRKSLILEGLKTYDELKEKLSKIKPDVISYDDSGNVKSENYSKSKIDEKIKLEKQFKEIEVALNAAISDGDYKKLQKK